jgi:chemotaxis-related protein WspD
MIDTDRTRPLEPPVPECWRVVGISGDHSCPELKTFIHCRNCPVLADAARTFFDRDPPPGYLDAWRRILEEPTADTDGETTSVLVFRLGKEWFALPATVLIEVTMPRALHRVPHRGGGLTGIVNIRGQLQLCLSLHALLGLDASPDATASAAGRDAPAAGFPAGAARLMVLEQDGPQGGDRWVVGVDEVAGVYRLPRATVRAVPATVGQAQHRCSTALFEWQERTVGLLDERLVFDGLAGMVAG